MNTARAILYVVLSACLVMEAHCHGRLTKPATRKPTGYENDPVPGYNSEAFVCRNAARNVNVPYTQVTAGGELTLHWSFGAAHVGDCAVYVSYETEAARPAQKYLKIANLPKCKDQNNQDVKVTIPDFLPAGNAVLRWDWYALHVFPTVEFYSQCVDIQITSTSAVQVNQLVTYSIIAPPIYPQNGNGGKFRNAFGVGEQFMTGPACAHGYTGNNCALTAVGTTGNTRSGGGALTGGGGPVATVVATTVTTTTLTTSTGSTVTYTPMCEIYTVVQGDTLSDIAQSYTANGKSVTWQQICTANAKADCDVIDVGDNYVIPYEGSACAAAGATTTTGTGSGTGGSGTGGSGTGGSTGNGTGSTGVSFSTTEEQGSIGSVAGAYVKPLSLITFLVIIAGSMLRFP